MKEIELVRSGLLVDMPHKVIDYRILDVLEALYKLTDRIGEAFIRETGRLDGRITALEERFERSLPSFEDMKGIFKEKPAPLSCCEGCVSESCENIDITPYVGKERPHCYREKPTPHTCGECKRPYWHTEATSCGLCPRHPSATGTMPFATVRGGLTCENFEAIK